MNRSISVKVIDKTAKKVTIKLISANRKMFVPLADFEKRVDSGVYDVVSSLTE